MLQIVIVCIKIDFIYVREFVQTVLPAMFPLKTSAKYVFVYREQPAITSQNFVSEENTSD